MHTEPPAPPDPGTSPSTPPAKPRRRASWFVPVTLAHFLLFPVLIVCSFGTSMRRFDSGGPPTAVERVTHAAVRVMAFPLVLPLFALNVHVDGPGQWALLLANSVCWGSGVSYVVRRLRR